MQLVGRWLALDYGRRRIGLALSDELGISCRPLGTLDLGTLDLGILGPGLQSKGAALREPDAATLDEAARRIAAECHAHDVCGVVVGDPRHASGDPMPITPWIDEQVDRLRAALRVAGLNQLTIARIDEHGSSQAGLAALGGRGVDERGLRHSGRLDSAAAAVLLREFLDGGGPARALAAEREERRR